MTDVFFIRLAKPEGSKVWEEADQYLYKNYRHVLSPDGTRRYDDDARFCVVNDVVDLSNMGAVPLADMNYVPRMLGLLIPQHTTGYCSSPKEMLTIVRGTGKAYYKDGFKYTGRIAA